jgi:hypothetical protein
MATVMATELATAMETAMAIAMAMATARGTIMKEGLPLLSEGISSVLSVLGCFIPVYI